MNPPAGQQNPRQVQRIGGRDHLVGSPGRPPHRAQQIHGLGSSELLADVAGYKSPAPHFSPRLHAAKLHQRLPPGRTQRLTRGKIAKNHTPPQQQLRNNLQLVGPAGRIPRHQRPPPGGMPRPRQPPSPLPAPPLGIHQRSQILKRIGGHQPCRDQFPQPVFHLAGQPPGSPRQLGEERSPPPLQRRQYLPRGMRQRRRRIAPRSRQPFRILPLEQGNRRRTRRPHPPRLAVLEGRMRRQPPPHHFTGQAQLIQPFRRIPRDAPRKNLALPGRRRNLITLQLPDHLQQSIHAMQLRASRQVLPAGKKAQKIGRRNRLDLAPQPPQRQPMNARQHAPVAPLLFRPLRKVPAQRLAFAFDPRQRNFHQIAWQRQPCGQTGNSHRAGRFQPAAQDKRRGGFLRLRHVFGLPGALDPRMQNAVRMRQQRHAKPFGGNPKRAAVDAEPCRPPRELELIVKETPLRGHG